MYHETTIEDLPMLLSTLKNKSERVNVSNILECLLGSFVQRTSIDSLEEIVLQFVLPTINQVFCEIVSEINCILENEQYETECNIIETLQTNLQTVIDILEKVNSFIIHMSSSGKYKVAQISSVPLHVIDMILETFKHCKTSESLYGDVKLSSVKHKLVVFFKKGHEVLLSFLTLLYDRITFACQYEHDLQLLTKLMEKLSSMGEILTGLDTKSIIELWKGYIRLAQLYNEHLKPVLNVSLPIAFLCCNIINHLRKISSQDKQDIKQIKRNVRISCVELKVIIKLCELFQDNLGSSHSLLLNLLLHLNMCSPSYLQYKQVLPQVADDIRKNLFVGTCPLLSLLLADQLFLKVYFRFVTQLSDAVLEMKLAYISLTIILTTKILQMDEADQEEWLKSLNLIKAILLTLHYCDSVVCFDVVIDGDNILDLYEALLINCSVLLCNILKQNDFPQLAHLLLFQLLRANMWPALFSSDLFVILCRFSSDDLCLNITQLLCEIIMKWNKIDLDCPQWVYVTQTCGRLFHLLTNDSKVHLITLYSPLQHPMLWKYLPLTDDLLSPFCSHLLKRANNDIEHFISESSDARSYNSMICSVSAINQCIELTSNVEGNTWKQNLYLLWQYISDPVYPWLYRLLSPLISLTLSFLSFMNNTEILIVLQCMSNVCSDNTFCQLLANELLQSLGSIQLPNDHHQLKLFHNISVLFAALLNETNPLVKIFSLETFEYFSSVTPHVAIVSESVARDEVTQNVVSQFLQRLPISEMIPSNTKEDILLSQKNCFEHRCKKTAKYIVTSDECLLSSVLQRILDDIVFINEHISQNKVSLTEQSLIKQIFCEIKALESSL